MIYKNVELFFPSTSKPFTAFINHDSDLDNSTVCTESKEIDIKDFLDFSTLTFYLTKNRCHFKASPLSYLIHLSQTLEDHSRLIELITMVKFLLQETNLADLLVNDTENFIAIINYSCTDSEQVYDAFLQMFICLFDLMDVNIKTEYFMYIAVNNIFSQYLIIESDEVFDIFTHYILAYSDMIEHDSLTQASINIISSLFFYRKSAIACIYEMLHTHHINCRDILCDNLFEMCAQELASTICNNGLCIF